MTVPTFVQGAEGQSGGGSVAATTFGSASTVGDLIVVAVTNISFLSTLVDNAGNTYTLAASVAGADDGVYYAWNIAVPVVGDLTITATFTTGGFYVILTHEYSGIATASNPLDATGSNTGNSASPSASLTTSSPNELLFGMFDTTGGGFVAGGGATERETFNFGSFTSQDQVVAAAGPTTSLASCNSGAWYVIAAAFKGPSSAPIDPIGFGAEA